MTCERRKQGFLEQYWNYQILSVCLCFLLLQWTPWPKLTWEETIHYGGEARGQKLKQRPTMEECCLLRTALHGFLGYLFTQRRPTCTRMAANNGLGLSPADIAIGQSDGRNSLRFLPFSQVTKTNHTLCNCYTHSTKSIFQFPTWLINPETYRLFLIALALTKLRNRLHTQSALHTPQPSPWSPLPIHIILVHKIPSLGPTARGTQSKSPFFKLFGPCLSP